MSNTKYYAAGISAFAVWGFFSFVLKPLAGYPSLDILFYRVFFSSAIMFFISMIIRNKVLKQNRHVFLLLPRRQKLILAAQALGGGMLLTTNWFFFIYVMNHVSLNAGSFAYIVCPIITTLLACVFLKEKLSLLQWIAVFLGAVSCIILSFNHLIDMLYSLIVGTSYAIYLVIQPKNKEIDKFLLLTVQIICSALMLLPFYPEYRGPVPAEPAFYLFIGIIAVFFTIVPLLLNLYALKGIKSSALGILLYINPLINFALAMFYFQEPIDTMQLLAYMIILVSVILFNLKMTDGKNSVKGFRNKDQMPDDRFV